jgi:HD-like signal output (HDOD) protein
MSSCMAHPADALLDRVPRLHSPPHVASRILELTRTLDYGFDEVAECLQADPALAAKVLRLANSSHTGLAQRVGSLRLAVSYLGHNTLRLVVVTFGLLDNLTRGNAGKLYGDFWHRALGMSSAAAAMCRMRGDLDSGEAYSAGLLADLGTLVLIQTCDDEYAELCRSLAHGPELVEAEREAFGIDHAQIGARLLERWQFPRSMCEAVKAHHDHRDAIQSFDLALAVHAADLIADVLWNRPSPRLVEARSLLHRALGLDVDGFVQLVLRTKEDLIPQAEVFSVTLREPVDCAALLAEAARRHDEAAIQTALELDSLEAVFNRPPPC